MSQEVEDTIKGIIQVLSEEDGEYRNYKDDSGFVVVIEKSKDFRKLKERIYIDFDDVIPEYVDKIVCSNGEVFINSLILCNNDYGISFVMNIKFLSPNLKEYMID